MRATATHRLSATLLMATLLLASVPSAVAGPETFAAYDTDLCKLAQRLIVNADGTHGPAPFDIEVLRGEGNGFHTIQMDVDAAARRVVIATTMITTQTAGETFPAYVACKLVDRDRVNDVLGLDLDGPERSCRDVNEYTHGQALRSLSADERARYEATGRPLRFTDDYIAATGGEWLPAAADDFIRPARQGGGLEVSAPSVRVPWNPVDRSFFQGTRHCKLVTLAAMRRWMLTGAASGATALFPRSKAACVAPSATSSKVGSCVFYFAPAGSRFCEDYTGEGWTAESARAECARRHASAEALREAANRYAGAGGLFSTETCTKRADALPLSGTCVFHCNRPDEALWRPIGAAATQAGGRSMMGRACDLFIE